MRAVLAELLGLFVEDGFLALALLGVVLAAALLRGLGAGPGAAGMVLLGGALAAVAGSALRGGGRR
ncbi:MAG TPA: hypothetical protein VE684_07600 [Crenalkalicoccus sp.]|nr:hypothetical protein [Crenalkalicoccus sp.]